MVCEQKRQLLADYLERTQALAIEAELLLDALGKEREEGWSYRWNRVEQARINCDIARLALSTHTRGHGC
ncbi:MAG TPA: hypothetical protein VG273_20640 [Bryobacteraceae bacterium]|jgi:hypothetical protein|nr:hypothetical protein [Bryobacteraceae bacterium]